MVLCSIVHHLNKFIILDRLCIATRSVYRYKVVPPLSYICQLFVCQRIFSSETFTCKIASNWYNKNYMSIKCLVGCALETLCSIMYVLVYEDWRSTCVYFIVIKVNRIYTASDCHNAIRIHPAFRHILYNKKKMVHFLFLSEFTYYPAPNTCTYLYVSARAVKASETCDATGCLVSHKYCFLGDGMKSHKSAAGRD